MASKTKVCPKCGIEKDRATEFRQYYDKNRGYNRTQPYCKACKNVYVRNKYHKDEKYREYCKAKSKQVRQSDKYKDKKKVWQKKYKDRITREVSDAYIRNSCKRSTPTTPEGFEIARAEILMYRINKKLKDG